MHCITFAFSQYFHAFRCVFYMLESCVLVGLDWAKPMMFLFVACHIIMHFSCIRTLIFIPFGIFVDWCFSSSSSSSLSFSWIVCTWHPSAKLLHPETLFVLRHLFLALLHFMSGFMMRRPVRTS